MTENKVMGSPDYIVAIGASAGGIEALEKLIRHLSPNINATYIIAQHLSPTHPSMLSELIERYSPLPVVSIKRTQALKSKTIYITPPNKDVEYEDGKVRLLKTSTDIGANPSINRLFSSLADSVKGKAIGVILSGTGSDGARGLKAIVNASGHAIVQDPDTAKYDGMPNAAMYALDSPNLMAPSEIGTFLHHLSLGTENSLPSKLPSDITEQLVDRISQQTTVNLQAFKRTTLERRILRRMSILNIKTIDRYYDYVRHNREEAKRFTESLSIAVTEFFRDKAIFDGLKLQLSDMLINKTEDDDPFRVWIIGCATGQEPYSIAMLLSEIAYEKSIPANYQIFATDISEKLISEARRGLYGQSSVENIEKNILEKYFEKRTDYYSVKKTIRDKIYFSTHNIVKDPHFSRIDLVSCRNVLIYLQEHAKEIALNSVFRALSNKGFFLIGNNESLGTQQKSFDIANHDLKIYKKNYDYEIPDNSDYQLPHIKTKIEKSSATEILPIEHQLSNVLCKEVVNPILLVDDQDNIVYTLGAVSNVLDIDSGPFDRNVNRLLKSEYRQTISSLISRYRKDQTGKPNKMMVHHSYKESMVVVIRQFDTDRVGWVVLELKRKEATDQDKVESIGEGEKNILSTMQDELSLTKQSLQLVIQELESTNQELQNSNEELQTTNEEMLSSNEELIATNEELHSTNEELVTVNEELEQKTYQLYNTSTDLENLQTSIELPLIVIGRDLRVKRYVNAVFNLLNHKTIQDDDLITALDWKTPIHQLKEKIKEVVETGARYREQVSMGDGYYQLYITPYIDEEGMIKGAIIFFADISRLTETQKDLKREKQLAHVTLENISDGVIRLNQNMTIDYINPAAQLLCGRREDDVLSRKISEVITILDEETREPLIDIFTPKDRQLQSSIAILINHNNEQITIEYFCTSLTSEDNRAGFLFVMRDISERQAALKRVVWQSTHDHLTGLVNRQEMESRLEKSLIHAKSKGHDSTFMFVDLDQFKIVNDTCGHLAGDELLRRITQQIVDQLRSRDTLARLGGDEFGVLLENCPLENSHAIAIKIRDAVSKYRFFWDEKLFKVGACVGLIAINKETHSVSQLLRDADSACYAAKSNGGNNIQIHMDSDEQLNEQKHQMSIITDINDALENKRFRLYYQPIYSSATGEISHWEVLVRMINRRHEFLLPRQFLPASERFGFMRQIDHWVITNALNSLQELYGLTDKRPKLAINLSASTLADKNCREKLVKILKESPDLQEQVIFEITETSALSNIDSVNLFIGELRQYGCDLALDDFGTGVSTYSYLKRLDVDMIKIDGEFIDDIISNEINQEIVKSIVHIAKLMNISTTAEWVESEEACRYLSDVGVDLLQGNYTGRPVPAEEFVSAVINDDIKIQSAV
ncbi:MAG: EAL domain-containing protein [Cellvibrionaceae bacterium]